MKKQTKTHIETTATQICDHFMQNCSAIISKKDYDYVVATIEMHLLEEIHSLEKE